MVSFCDRSAYLQCKYIGLIIFNVDYSDIEESGGSDELYEPNSDDESEDFECESGTNKRGPPKKSIQFFFHFDYLVIG